MLALGEVPFLPPFVPKAQWFPSFTSKIISQKEGRVKMLQEVSKANAA